MPKINLFKLGFNLFKLGFNLFKLGIFPNFPSVTKSPDVLEVLSVLVKK